MPQGTAVTSCQQTATHPDAAVWCDPSAVTMEPDPSFKFDPASITKELDVEKQDAATMAPELASAVAQLKLQRRLALHWKEHGEKHAAEVREGDSVPVGALTPVHTYGRLTQACGATILAPGPPSTGQGDRRPPGAVHIRVAWVRHGRVGLG